jgi:hypothetical protein
MTVEITENRWKLFGKILRLPLNTTPAQIMMSCYFTDIVVHKRRGRKPTSLPQILDQDIEMAGCGNLRNDVDLEILRMKAHNFEEWDQICKSVVGQRKAFETLRAHDAQLKEKERVTRERVKKIEKREKRQRVVQEHVKKKRTKSESFEEEVESTSRRMRCRLTSGVEIVIESDVQVNIGSNFTVGWPGLGAEPAEPRYNLRTRRLSSYRGKTR